MVVVRISSLALLVEVTIRYDISQVSILENRLLSFRHNKFCNATLKHVLELNLMQSKKTSYIATKCESAICCYTSYERLLPCPIREITYNTSQLDSIK